MSDHEIKGLDSSAVQYYLKHRDQYSLRDEEGTMFPGALFLRGSDGQFRKGKSILDQAGEPVSYDFFVEGQLKYRRLNNNADY